VIRVSGRVPPRIMHDERELHSPIVAANQNKRTTSEAASDVNVSDVSATLPRLQTLSRDRKQSSPSVYLVPRTLHCVRAMVASRSMADQGSSLCQVPPRTNIHPEPSHALQIIPKLRPSPLQTVHSRQSLNCVAIWLIPWQSLSS